MNSTGKFDDYKLGVNQQSTPDNIALFEAAERGDLGRVRALLDQGAKPNFFYRPEDQKNSLHIAAQNGHADVVKLLLEHGAVPNAVAATDQSTALILAAEHPNNAALIDILVGAGAIIEAVNCYGNSALHEACRCGNEIIAKALINYGAPINLENHKGSTPLHIFCYGENPSTHTLNMLEYLVQEGADVHKADHRGLTPLLVACGAGREDVIRALLNHGASLAERDLKGRGAVDIATFYHQQNVLDFLNDFTEESKSHK